MLHQGLSKCVCLRCDVHQSQAFQMEKTDIVNLNRIEVSIIQFRSLVIHTRSSANLALADKS